MVHESHNQSFVATVIDGGYDVGSGVLSAVDKGVRTELNTFGLYSSVLDPSAYSIDESKLATVSAMSDHKYADEDEIARTLFGSVPGVKKNPVIGHYRLFGHLVGVMG